MICKTCSCFHMISRRKTSVSIRFFPSSCTSVRISTPSLHATWIPCASVPSQFPVLHLKFPGQYALPYLQCLSITKVYALGHGFRPLTRRSSSSAVSEIHQSHLFGDHSRIRCRTLSGCFSISAVPCSIDGSVLISRSAPACASFPNRLPPVSSVAESDHYLRNHITGIQTFSHLLIVTPDTFSPSITACWIGAAPLYFGRRDA